MGRPITICYFILFFALACHMGHQSPYRSRSLWRLLGVTIENTPAHLVQDTVELVPARRQSRTIALSSIQNRFSPRRGYHPIKQTNYKNKEEKNRQMGKRQKKDARELSSGAHRLAPKHFLHTPSLSHKVPAAIPVAVSNSSISQGNVQPVGSVLLHGAAALSASTSSPVEASTFSPPGYLML